MSSNNRTHQASKSVFTVLHFLHVDVIEVHTVPSATFHFSSTVPSLITLTYLLYKKAEVTYSIFFLSNPCQLFHLGLPATSHEMLYTLGILVRGQPQQQMKP